MAKIDDAPNNFLRAFMVVMLLAFPTEVAAVTDACKQKAKNCSAAELCAVLRSAKAKWDYPTYTMRARDLGLSCAGGASKSGNATTPLSRSFNALAKKDRMAIQSFLQNYDFYQSKVDGIFGVATKAALEGYNASIGGGGLSSQDSTRIFLQKILMEIVNSESANADPSGRNPTTFGTGFFVSYAGHIVTNHHVIDGCMSVTASLDGLQLSTSTVSTDPINDLALLKMDYLPQHVFALSEISPYPLQDIVVIGFPFGDGVSAAPKFTRGVISSVAGFNNNFSELQVDAAMQPGSSGGPIIDQFGNVVAVSFAKLSLRYGVDVYGAIPENTNFGIKASSVRNLMEGSGVPLAEPGVSVFDSRLLAETTSKGVVLLSCWSDQ